ncbi:unnamed protein product [Parnassius apollo]|uniref:(apollo) hypothetical protein n=1 Tax=Parnassius apollo TaxID=110799 RepID=A0A8S3Y055_PARAO|nr:unnamed protein product [Parnassius apollo]
MGILKGVPKDVPAEDLVKIIRHQNTEIAEIANDSIDINNLSLRFKHNNRNENFYNAVFLVGPKIYRKIKEMGRVCMPCIDHQRIHLENFS